MFQKYDKLICGGFFIIISVVMLSQISTIRFVDVAMGARFFPRLVGIMMLIVGGLLTITGLFGLKEARQRSVPKIDKRMVKHIVFSLLMVAIFGVLMPLMGVIIAGIVFLAGSFFILTPKEKWKIPLFLIVSVVLTVVVYFLFTEGFRMVLPSGTLWR